MSCRQKSELYLFKGFEFIFFLQLENGYDINEMDATLLEKIENLYLYIIDQKKEIDLLKIKITELSTKNNLD